MRRKRIFGKTYHFLIIAWYQFALKIKKEIEKKDIPFSPITPIRTKDYVSKIMAQRPYYSALDSSKVMSEYNLKASDFQNGIKNSINCFLSNHKL